MTNRLIRLKRLDSIRRRECVTGPAEKITNATGVPSLVGRRPCRPNGVEPRRVTTSWAELPDVDLAGRDLPLLRGERHRARDHHTAGLRSVPGTSRLMARGSKAPDAAEWSHCSTVMRPAARPTSPGPAPCPRSQRTTFTEFGIPGRTRDDTAVPACTTHAARGTEFGERGALGAQARRPAGRRAGRNGPRCRAHHSGAVGPLGGVRGLRAARRHAARAGGGPQAGCLGAGLQPVGKRMDSPPYPKMMRPKCSIPTPVHDVSFRDGEP